MNTSDLLLLVRRESWYEAATVTAVGFGFSSEFYSCGVGRKKGAIKRQRIAGIDTDNPTVVVLSHCTSEYQI